MRQLSDPPRSPFQRLRLYGRTLREASDHARAWIRRAPASAFAVAIAAGYLCGRVTRRIA